MTIAILGAGAFGTALACTLSRGGKSVTLWGREILHMQQTRKNTKLADTNIPNEINITDKIADIKNASITLLVVPAQKTDLFLSQNAEYLPDTPLVLCAKGIDLQTHDLQTDIFKRHLPKHSVAVLTGPGFATEIANGLPTALTLACEEHSTGLSLQKQLSTEYLRLYLTQDITGAQLGGALKNVIAIAAGIVVGAGLGESARSALITRGFVEMRRLGVAMGGKEETFIGLSGFGDLTLTCSSQQSRNFAQGYALGSGHKQLEGITIEGVATARAACALAEKYNVDMPITHAVASVVSGKTHIKQAVETLLSRPLKQE